MEMVGYLVNYPDGISGEKGIYYNYILAANGLFIEASNPMLAARVPVSDCEVRGLAPMKSKIALTYGSIPQHFFDLALDTFLADPDREHYVAVTAAAGYSTYRYRIRARPVSFMRWGIPLSSISTPTPTCRHSSAIKRTIKTRPG